jgi:Dolichyl-phosphate-mannose-protein mannosyltransferase
LAAPGRPAWRIILAVAAIKVAIHLYTSAFYNFFRDELYFIACGRHLDWGYVDHSPLIGVYARIGDLLEDVFGLRGFRLLATLAGAARIVLTGVITARLGAGRVAQALACTAVLLCPMYLAMDGILTMNAFEHLFVLGAVLILVELANGASERWWLAFGVVAGLGLLNKHSMVFFGFALIAALLVTPLRRSFARPWIYAGGAIAVLIFLPNVIWQWQHGFPTLELLRNVKETGKNVVLAPLPFLKQQAMMLNPLFAPLWIAGLFALLFARPYRFLAIAYLVLLALFIRMEAKDYYVAPIYPVLFAAGAVWVARWRAAVLVAFVLVIGGGAISAPLVLPFLPPERYLAYQRALGIEPQRTEVSHTSELPQLFADQFGWEELVRTVARYYHSLPVDERKKTAIYCGNYGEAGAIDFYGPKYGLPRAISGHQNYFLWGPRDTTGESIILVGDDPQAEMWESLRVVATHHHPYGMPFENGPIHHGRGLELPIDEVWPETKEYR